MCGVQGDPGDRPHLAIPPSAHIRPCPFALLSPLPARRNGAVLSRALHGPLLVRAAARERLAFAGGALLDVAAVVVDAAPSDVAVAAPRCPVPELVARLVAPPDGSNAMPRMRTGSSVQPVPSIISLLQNMQIATASILPSCRGENGRRDLGHVAVVFRGAGRDVSRRPLPVTTLCFDDGVGTDALAQAIDELLAEGASMYGDAEAVPRLIRELSRLESFTTSAVAEVSVSAQPAVKTPCKVGHRRLAAREKSLEAPTLQPRAPCEDCETRGLGSMNRCLIEDQNLAAEIDAQLSSEPAFGQLARLAHQERLLTANCSFFPGLLMRPGCGKR